MRAVATPAGHDHLFAFAEGQEGYFTMAQALSDIIAAARVTDCGDNRFNSPTRSVGYCVTA